MVVGGGVGVADLVGEAVAEPLGEVVGTGDPLVLVGLGGLITGGGAVKAESPKSVRKSN